MSTDASGSSSANKVLTPITPSDVLNHKLEDVVIIPLTSKEFIKAYGGVAFDYNELKVEFAKVCKDFAENVVEGASTYCLSFAAEVFYKVAPEARRVSKTAGDKAWRFRMGESWVFISTFKNSQPPSESPKVKNNTLLLTIKQAGLLSCSILTKWAHELYKEAGSMVLTPLAGSVFSKDDGVKLAEIMWDTDKPNDREIASTMAVINSSCQPGGFHLKSSRMDIALVAAINAVKKCTEKEKRSIVDKTSKQYIAKNKPMDLIKFKKYIEFSNGGVPLEYSFDSLSAIFKSEKEVVKCKSCGSRF